MLRTPDDFDETNRFEVQSYIEDTQPALQTDENPKITREVQEIIRLAQSNAKGWIETIQLLYADTYVNLNEGKLRLLARKEGRKIAEELSKSNSYEGLEELLDIYVEHFLGQFAETSKDDEHIGPMLSAQDWEIQSIVARDKEDAPPRHMRHYHQRDLGVIQAIRHLHISLDDAPNHLEEIHSWADKYDKMYSNPRKGVEWPTPDTFPGK
ncbi:hypothetical protein [Dictyobacter arantiisoli]|uniref:Uncharacterized protein n=1 Tax=Dictyobacter arantiisoli TaxID=2014874 RepID=A0A5A5TA13_9CHLR|nr:hypothetical protein [Dictyobacter arantiisoli]GCF07744.1 hypothetical protein KDI_13080 [Dictyobacter arantiisoli]